MLFQLSELQKTKLADKITVWRNASAAECHAICCLQRKLNPR